jgi:glycine/D-amino acid oxidase-like deaminating enzyme
MVGGYTSIYDCTPDLMPLLGRVPGLDGLSVAVGFSGHGFKIAPAVGEMLADDLLDETDSAVRMFRISRFEEGDAFVAPHPYSVPTLG